MNKFSLIPLAIIALVGVVWATSSLPDTPEFPSNPNNPGTLGYILSYFGSDGTAPNTEKLGGISASGYLRGANCPTDQVWKGIDTSGQAICGSRGVLLAFAKILEGSMQVNGKTKPPGTILYENDRIDTNVGQTGTIQFTNDISIARLSTSTSIILERGNTAGTIAQVVLDQGLLWGRVLTSTGINIGGGGLIAGVRGTSVSVEKGGDNTYSIIIPHSQNSKNSATLMSSASSRSMGVREAIRYTGKSTVIPTSSQILNLTQLYNTNTWVRENTVKDLAYLYSFGGSNPTVTREIESTEPTILADKQKICTSTTGIWYKKEKKCVYAYAELTNTNLKDNQLYTHTSAIELTPTSWTSSGSETTSTIYLQDNGGLLGYQCPGSVWKDKKTEYKSPSNPIINMGQWYKTTDIKGYLGYSTTAQATLQGLIDQGKVWIQFNNSLGTRCDASGDDKITYNIATKAETTESLIASNVGIKIDGKKYLKYVFPGNDYNVLKGKTIEIGLNSSLERGTLIDLGSNTKIAYISGTWKYNVGSGWTDPSDTSIIEYSPDSYSRIKFKVPKEASVDKLIIGNNSDVNFSSPIGTSIKYISIY